MDGECIVPLYTNAIIVCMMTDATFKHAMHAKTLRSSSYILTYRIAINGRLVADMVRTRCFYAPPVAREQRIVIRALALPVL